MPTTTPALILALMLADVALQFVLVGTVAAILLIALALTLLSRSGRGNAADGHAQSSQRARGGEAKQSTAPSAPDLYSHAPAQPVSGAAPRLYEPPHAASPTPPSYQAPQSPPPLASAQPAPAAPARPATERDDGVPIATPWESVPEPYAPPVAPPYAPPVAQTTPPPNAEGYGTAAPVTGAPPDAAPSAPPPPAPPEPGSAPFTPTAGSASSDIAFEEIEAIERERASGDQSEAAVDTPALPRRVPVTTADSRSRATAASETDGVEQGQRAEAPPADKLVAIEPAAGGASSNGERLRGTTLGGVDRQQADQAPSRAPTAASTAASLQFTSFYPREVPTQQWQTLLVYNHIADALEAVRRDALKFAEELGERPRVMHAAASQPVERGTTLTIVPSCAGVHFNPERLSRSWDEDWQRSSFRFSVADELAGSAAAGEIAVYVGPLILAILKFGLLVSDASQPSEHLSSTQQQTVGPASVFASYSHDDTPVVLACRNAYRALGLTVNIDLDTLRSGDQWDPRLMQLIAGSDVFQLFWSARAASSEAVQREWRYALAHSRGAGYIRPVYWEQPLIAPPPELANVHFAYIDLPRE